MYDLCNIVIKCAGPTWFHRDYKRKRLGIVAKVQENEKDKLKLLVGGGGGGAYLSLYQIFKNKYKKIYILSTVLSVLHLFVAKNWGISVLSCGNFDVRSDEENIEKRISLKYFYRFKNLFCIKSRYSCWFLVLVNSLRGVFLYVIRNTRSKVKTNAYNISLEVMTKFKIFIFRNVSQSENKLKKYI
jgi:hypothetical protein